MNHKRGLDIKVAHLLGVPEKKVGDITSEFFNQLSILLGEEGGAVIQNFGRFNVSVTNQDPRQWNLTGMPRSKKRKLGNQIRVWFACSDPLRRTLKKYNTENSHV